MLTGAALPALVGAVPGDVVAFRWIGSWQQVPVQVDERVLVDLNQPFGSYTCTTGYCFTLPSAGSTALQYADAGTYTGADSDATLDPDDEVVFMAKDTGDRPATFADPAGVVAGSGVEVHATDPVDGGEGWVYLFRQAGGLDPSAGASYVSYAFQLLSGAYPATYQRGGGPNLESSTVTSASYTRHFSDRWLDDGLAITAGAATGVDVLDRAKVLVDGFGCGRSEDTFDAGEGCFVTNKSGPVRAIRSYMGANSGPQTQRQHLFYERREDVQTFVRVHALPGLLFFQDYSPAAAGMTYRNDGNPAGVTIDGAPDAVTAASFTWETVDGPQGALTILTTIDTNVPGFGSTSLYVDDVAAPQCTGDASSYGASGVWMNVSLPSTEASTSNRLVLTRITYFDAPGGADGPGRRARLDQPLAVTATALGGGGTPVGVASRKLVVVDDVARGKGKLTYVATDAAVTKGAGTDVAAISASVRITYTGPNGVVTGAFTVPAGPSDGTSGWVANSASSARYANKLAPGGPTRAKLALVRPGKLLKLVGKGLGDAEPLLVTDGGAPAGAVATAYCVTNGGESTCHCSSFVGCVYKAFAGGGGSRLACKAGVADPACSALP